MHKSQKAAKLEEYFLLSFRTERNSRKCRQVHGACWKFLGTAFEDHDVLNLRLLSSALLPCYSTREKKKYIYIYIHLNLRSIYMSQFIELTVKVSFIDNFSLLEVKWISSIFRRILNCENRYKNSYLKSNFFPPFLNSIIDEKIQR